MIPIINARRKRDEAKLAEMNQSDKPSRFVTKSNKLKDPNTGDRIKRGSIVQSKVSSKTSMSPGKPEFEVKSKVESGNLSVEKKYTAGDYNPPGKPIADRVTTKEIGTSMKENPAKTNARIEAQSNSQTSYDYKGKKEYSGRNETVVKTPSPKRTEEVSVKRTPEFSQTKEKSIGVKQPNNSGGNLGLRIKRVAGINNKGQGQNYKRLDVVAGKKTIPIIKFKTRTRRTK